MATSYRGLRGASHYHALPNNHDLYTNLATTWSSASHGLSRPPPAPVSGLLQRFGASSPVQRSFTGADGTDGTDGSYLGDYGPPGEYVNNPSSQQSQPQPTQNQTQPSSSWQASPVTATGAGADAGAWSESSLPYTNLNGRAPHHQHPPHPPHQQHNSAPVARLLNYPNSDLHSAPPQALSQAPLVWHSPPNDVVPPTSTHHHPSHTAVALSSDLVLANPGNLESSSWGMQTSPVYEQMPAIEPAWSQVDAQPAHLGYMHQPHLTHHHSQPHSRSHHDHHEVAAPRNRTRRLPPKKSVPKVPAAFVERQEKVKVSKRKGPLTEESRIKTHQMRRDKTTCLRCRFYKSGCDSGEPCQKCLKTEGNARSFKLPCIRERLEDATLVRHCNGRSNQEEGEFLTYEWASDPRVYNMEIIWNLPGYGPITTDQPMLINYRQYHPQRPFFDTTTNVWSNTEGQIKVVEQPPYAVYDTASLAFSFESYFSHLQPAIEKWIFKRVQDDEIAMLTYREVQRLRRRPDIDTSLLDLVMRIQCLSVVSQGYGTVWSNNIPGIQTFDFAELGRSEYEAYDRTGRDRPLPGAINHQMDVAALKYLKKMERQCVKELSSMMFKSKIKPWYELFLALYVLFWNMEYIHRGANKYIMAKNGTAIQTQVSSVVNTQIKKWDWAFQVLKHHWIAVLRGYMPFKLARENPDELRDKGHLDMEGFQYVMKVAQIFDQIGFGQSTSPFVGHLSAHNSMSSHWIKTLFTEAGA